MMDSINMPEKNMNYFLQAIQELRSVPIPDYEERVEDICRDLDDEAMEQAGWPAEFFAQVLALLSDSRFLSVRTSWHVLHFIKNNWKLVSAGEAAELKKVLVAGYDRFGDWMGPFLASEILGKFYPDGDTLEILKKLGKAARVPAGELVPHGIETLARTTKDETLRDLAIRELQKLGESDSEHVRREAQISLEKIKKGSA
jgi:hypothetical protein